MNSVGISVQNNDANGSFSYHFSGPDISISINMGEVFVAIVMAILALGLLWLGVSSYKKKRLIEGTPTSKIRSLAMGFVEVNGVVEPFEKTFVSPLTRKNCVWYSYAIRQKRGKSVDTLKEGEESAPFFVRDETGAVLVDPKNAEVLLKEDLIGNSGWLRDPPEGVKEFLEKNGISHESLLMNKNLSFTESSVCVGESVYVLGTAGLNPSAPAGAIGSSDHVSQILIQSGGRMPFVISDKGERGVTDAYSWWPAFVAGGILFAVGFTAFVFSRLGML